MKKPLNFLVLIFMLCILAFTLTACSGDNNDGGETPPSHTHENSTEYTYDNDYHWYECECGEKSNVENHSGGTATCTTLAECSVCGEGYGEFENHDYAELKYNATEHWYECECGEKSNVEKHSGGTPTCTVLAECSVCGEGYGEYSDHTYKKGKCDCGAIDPTYMTEGLKFNLINNYTEYEVSGYTGTSTEVIIPTFYQNKPVTSIEERAFMGCDSLKSIVLPSSVTSIGELPFAVCTSLESIDVAEDNPNYKDIDGNLYTKDGKVLLQYAIGKTASQFIISNSVTSIGIGAFAFCTSLTSITIGNSVTSIGEHAFDSCTSLTSIEIPNSVTNIGVGAFAYCESLNYNIKNELKYLGNSNNPYL